MSLFTVVVAARCCDRAGTCKSATRSLGCSLHRVDFDILLAPYSQATSTFTSQLNNDVSVKVGNKKFSNRPYMLIRRISKALDFVAVLLDIKLISQTADERSV